MQWLARRFLRPCVHPVAHCPLSWLVYVKHDAGQMMSRMRWLMTANRWPHSRAHPCTPLSDLHSLSVYSRIYSCHLAPGGRNRGLSAPIAHSFVATARESLVVRFVVPCALPALVPQHTPAYTAIPHCPPHVSRGPALVNRIGSSAAVRL